MREFFRGPVIKTELLVVWLEKHGLTAAHEFLEPAGSPDDLDRDARVLVTEAEYDRAYQIFYSEREGEL